MSTTLKGNHDLEPLVRDIRDGGMGDGKKLSYDDDSVLFALVDTIENLSQAEIEVLMEATGLDVCASRVVADKLPSLFQRVDCMVGEYNEGCSPHFYSSINTRKELALCDRFVSEFSFASEVSTGALNAEIQQKMAELSRTHVSNGQSIMWALVTLGSSDKETSWTVLSSADSFVRMSGTTRAKALSGKQMVSFMRGGGSVCLFGKNNVVPYETHLPAVVKDLVREMNLRKFGTDFE